MSSPFQHSQNTQRHDNIYDPAQPHITYARVAAASESRERTGSTSRTGPTSFSNILNPSDADWSPAAHRNHNISGSARDWEPAGIMTQNGGNLDGAAGASSFYAAPSQQLPESSRAFELFMNRSSFETLPGVEAVLAGRTDPIHTAAGGSGTTTSYNNFPRPSYLEGSSYLARLEQQARQKALLHSREPNGSQAANGAGKNSASQSYHMGIARDVVERTPAHEQEEDAIGPLPTKWGTSKEEKASGLELLSDDLEVKCTARNPNEREHEAYAVRADHPMPVQCGLYYFEVTILSRKHTDTTIAIGFSSKSVSLNRAPGWESESWGYHGDDGHVFASQNVGRNYGPLFSGGDTIGCGVNFRTNSAFFTKNGHLIGPAFKEVKGKLYPSVGLKKTGEHVRVNFGQTRSLGHVFPLWIHEVFDDPIWQQQPGSRRQSAPLSSDRAVLFSFDQQRRARTPTPSRSPWCTDRTVQSQPLQRPASPATPQTPDDHQVWTLDEFIEKMSDSYWTERGWKEIHHLEAEISKADTSKLAPPLNETDLIQQLVLQFLQHDGYVETARAFAQEIQTEKQSLCLDPNVQVPGIDIKDDEDANNRQRIRRAILEGDIDKALKHTNAYYPQVLQENEQVYFRLRCRKFIEMIRREAEMNLVGGERRSQNGHNHPPQGEEMELDDDDNDVRDSSGQRGSDGAGDLTQVALLYGQSLQAEYAGDKRKEVQQALEDIFSLMAYPNPLKESKVAHLLDRKGRVAVAEELNSVILQSLGKSSRAAIENVYAQTSVLLDDLAENGGPGAFVTMKSIIDEVEPSKSDF